MGYHRDPEHYPQITPFHCEMRRRLWATLLQLDILSSFQLGLPTIVQEPPCDTKLPGNYLDTDLLPDAKDLPTQRPETESTPVLYQIAKGRILEVFRLYINQVSSSKVITYETTLALDKQLRAAHFAIPASHKLSRSEDRLTINAGMIIRQYNIELLYEKARCILHRNHMTESYRNPEYFYSRQSCVEAAMNVLKHQGEIFAEVQPSGRLFRDKWFLSTFEYNDFLLAAMIVCLELKSGVEDHQINTRMSGGDRVLGISRDDMIKMLKSTRVFWQDFGKSSLEIRQASIVLSNMLDKLSVSEDDSHMSNDPRPGLDRPTPFNGLQTPMSTMNGGLLRHGHPELIDMSLSAHAAQITPETQQSFSEIGEMLQNPDLFDWDLWDAHMKDSGQPMEFEN
jgi:hypothetical protein